MALTVAGGPTGFASSITVAEDPSAADRAARIAAWEESRQRDPYYNPDTGQGRPMVMLPDGSGEAPYKRASSYGAPLESSWALDAWKLRQVARGMANSPQLRLRATRAEVNLDSDVPDVVKRAKRDLDKIAGEAMDLAGSSDKAHIGTALHDITERFDRGVPLGFVPDEWLADVAEYQRLIADFDVLSIERIVVEDELRIGGTLDRILRLRRPMVVRKAKRRYKSRSARSAVVLPAGTVVTGDVKTAQGMDFAGAKFGCQVWAYTSGLPYNPIIREREPWGHDAPCADWAVIIHVPSGQGQGSLHWVDLVSSRQAAMDAHTCYEWRNKWGRRLIDEQPDEDTCRPVLEGYFRELATAATTLGELHELHRQAVACGCWADRLREVFTRTREEIEMRAEQSATEAVSA